MAGQARSTRYNWGRPGSQGPTFVQPRFNQGQPVLFSVNQGQRVYQGQPGSKGHSGSTRVNQGKSILPGSTSVNPGPSRVNQGQPGSAEVEQGQLGPTWVQPRANQGQSRAIQGQSRANPGPSRVNQGQSESTRVKEGQRGSEGHFCVNQGQSGSNKATQGHQEKN